MATEPASARMCLRPKADADGVDVSGCSAVVHSRSRHRLYGVENLVGAIGRSQPGVAAFVERALGNGAQTAPGRQAGKGRPHGHRRWCKSHHAGVIAGVVSVVVRVLIGRSGGCRRPQPEACDQASASLHVITPTDRPANIKVDLFIIQTPRSGLCLGRFNALRGTQVRRRGKLDPVRRLDVVRLEKICRHCRTELPVTELDLMPGLGRVIKEHRATCAEACLQRRSRPVRTHCRSYKRSHRWWYRRPP